jgi:hypothetical protein
MPPNPLGSNIQGCVPEGQSPHQSDGTDEWPVLIAFEDTSVPPVKKVPNIGTHGGVIVEPAIGGAGQAVTIADCADAAEGCIADAAVTGDNPGTVSSKLRGLNKILADVWDNINHLLRVGASQVGSWTVTANQGTAGAFSWPVIQPDVNIAGTATPGNPIVLNVDNLGSAFLSVSAISGGAIVFFEAQAGDGNWTPWPWNQSLAAPTQGGINTQTASAGTWWVTECGGPTQLRFRVAVGTATIRVNASSAASNMFQTLACPAIGTNLPADSIVNPPVDTSFDGRTSVGKYTYPYIFGGAQWTKTRSPSVFKTAQATASGSSPLWTPTAGKKFRLLRYCIFVTGNAIQTAAGVITIKLLDSAADIAQDHDVYIPSAALNTNGTLYSSGWIDLGNIGILSAAINNVLNINLSAALTGGNVRVISGGTEE